MEQSVSCVELKVAQINPNEEEYAGDTEQKSNDATTKDVQVLLKGEECALGTEQRSNDAAVKDAQT